MGSLWIETSEGFLAEPLGPGGMAGVSSNGHCRFVHFGNGAQGGHALLAGPDDPVRVNGEAVIGGIHVLAHKDELFDGARRMFFSSESAPQLETYRHDGQGHRARCPVCRAAIQDGQTVVRCPRCERVYHQIAATGDTQEKPCWTYSPTCRFCDHPTSLSGNPIWRPEMEEEQ